MTIKIDQAFITALLALEPDMDIVWENGAYSVWGGALYAHAQGIYEPTNGREYIEAFLIPNDITAYGLSSTNETDGLFRCILRYPENTGSIAAKTKADEILAGFPIGTRITYSGQSVTVTSGGWREGTAPDENWYSLIVSIGYRTFISRG